MIARATLALFLAGPALASGLTVGTATAAASTVTRKTTPSAAAARDRLAHASPRRARAATQAARPARRDEKPAIVASFDDGFAYDTPRDAQGHPIRLGQGQSTTAWQTGTASWYGGSQWQGHRMSDGSRYEQNDLTAAHASLPLGTLVRVSRLDDSRSVIVRITDRPGTHLRVIDLSRAAASQLGMLNAGVTKVRLDPL